MIKKSKWHVFLKKHMGAKMRKHGGDHGKAIREIALLWKKNKK